MTASAVPAYQASDVICCGVAKSTIRPSWTPTIDHVADKGVPGTASGCQFANVGTQFEEIDNPKLAAKKHRWLCANASVRSRAAPTGKDQRERPATKPSDKACFAWLHFPYLLTSL